MQLTKLAPLALAAAFLVTASSNAAAVVISAVPSATEVDLGSGPLAVELRVSGLGDMSAPAISAYDIDVTFDSSVLDFQSATFGSQLDLLGFGSIAFVDDFRDGVVNLFELSFDLASDLLALQADAFVLATLQFEALAVGTSAIGVGINQIGDEAGNTLMADAVSGSVDVTSAVAVPEPAVAQLLLAGGLLFGLRGARQRRTGGC